MKKTLVIGVGNTLLSDEGVGVAVAKALMDEELPAGVQVMDAGCALCDMLIGLDEFDQVIIVDAVRGGGNPGDIYRFDSTVLADRSSAPHCSASLHEIGLLESIAMAEIAGTEVPPITIIGVEPLKLELSTELSNLVKSKIPNIVEVVRREIAGVPKE